MKLGAVVEIASTFKRAETISAPSSDNRSHTWSFLINSGFTANQAAGIMGNLQQEHGFQTSDVPGGLGIAQWMGSRRDRLMAMPNYLSLSTQLEFMLSELNGIEHVAGNAIKAATTIEAATIAFQNKYERCGQCMQSQRIQYAMNIYDRFTRG